MNKNQLGKERVYFKYTSTSQSITEVSQGRSRDREVSLLMGLLSLCSYSKKSGHRTKHGPTYSEQDPSTPIISPKKKKKKLHMAYPQTNSLGAFSQFRFPLPKDSVK